MTSIRTTRLFAGAFLAATLAVGGPLPSATAAGRSVPTTDTDPAHLAAGGPPRVAYLDRDAEQIVLPSGETLSTERFRANGKKYNGGLLQAPGGYVLNVDVYKKAASGDRMVRVGTRIVHLSTSGRIRTVAAASAYSVGLVSSDGRWLIAGHRSKPALRVLRLSDGKVVATRAFRGAFRLSPMAAGGGRVLVRWMDCSAKCALRTIVWSPAAKRTRLLHQSQPRPLATWADAAATIGGHEYVVTTRTQVEQVRDLRNGRLLWRTRGHLLSFSPDNKRVLTDEGTIDADESPYTRASGVLRVRNARTGRVLATFTGYLSSAPRGSDFTGPVWESDTSLLLHVTSPPVFDPETGYTNPNPSLIRCSVVSGACTKVLVDPEESGIHLLQRKSN